MRILLLQSGLCEFNKSEVIVAGPHFVSTVFEDEKDRRPACRSMSFYARPPF